MCKVIRSNDEYQCSCGLCWGVDEADPHVTQREKLMVARVTGAHQKLINEALTKQAEGDFRAETVKAMLDEDNLWGEYRSDALFNKSMQAIVAGTNPAKVIAELCSMVGVTK